MKLAHNKKKIWHIYKKYPKVIWGFFFITILIFLALTASIISPYEPLQMNFDITLQPPNMEHLMGTDQFGRDIFSRVIYGSRISLIVSSVASVGALIAGLFLGSMAGYFSKLDNLIMRVMDIVFSFPALLVAIIIVAVTGRGIQNLMMALAIVYTPTMARVTRSSFLSIKQETYIKAAKALGQSDAWIILRHILPNVMGPIIVQFTLCLAYAILTEAALSYLGLGTSPPTPSWGGMLSEGQGLLNIAPWIAFCPGFGIIITVMSFNLMGDGLRDMLDPRLRGKIV